MFGYRVPAPNEALLISGRKQKQDAPQFKIVTGHGVFVTPIFARASRMTLAMQEAEVTEDCFTQQGLTVCVHAVIAFKVGDDHDSIAAAARRFQGDQSQMPTLVGRIFSGHLRSIIGSMTVEAIIREQQTLGEAILDASKVEMGKIGLTVDSLQISSISDKGIGYIASLAAPHQAAVQQAAKIAQAAANQASVEAEQESERNQAQYFRQSAIAKAQYEAEAQQASIQAQAASQQASVQAQQESERSQAESLYQTALARAKYQAEVEAAQQTAAQSGPLAAAQAQQAVLAEQAKVAERNGELREAQLIAEVLKPAQAEGERIRALAQANADAAKMAAAAAAAEDRLSLDQLLIQQLPDMIRAAAQGLQGSNLTVLDGAEGLTSVVASLASQGAALLDVVRSSGLVATTERRASTGNGLVPTSR
jgi:uncharacterized membrane protein YqiK